jgi:outer membrane protein assembly factor BamE (lipoprotein component of BamABCDE complex)
MVDRPVTRLFAVCSLSALLLLGACAASGPARNDELFARIQQGMSKDDVQRIAGTPDEMMHFPLTNTDAWGYRYFDSWGFYSEYSVTFGADGRAVAMISQRIGYGGRGS